jgi:tetraacyldisaccharide 4'-kinase
MNPLSAIFGAGVAVRNSLYDRGVFKGRRLSRPVVSIGNLSVGGSGKTPFVIALGELLKARGIAFDVLSRGYGRNAAGISVVDPNGSPEEYGDEPVLIASRLQVPVIVGADRYQAGLQAEKDFVARLHLLDDGFQHRRLHRDFDIVMLPAEDLQDTLLPVGRLREPLSSTARADVLVRMDRDPFEKKQVWHARRELTIPATEGKAVAFCGIARPRQFLFQLREHKVELAETVTFPDHHRYTERDVDRLLQLKAGSGAHAFVATEKDKINLGPLAGRLQSLVVAQLRMVLEDPETAVNTLLRTLEQRCGCRF